MRANLARRRDRTEGRRAGHDARRPVARPADRARDAAVAAREPKATAAVGACGGRLATDPRTLPAVQCAPTISPGRAGVSAARTPSSLATARPHVRLAAATPCARTSRSIAKGSWLHGAGRGSQTRLELSSPARDFAAAAPTSGIATRSTRTRRSSRPVYGGRAGHRRDALRTLNGTLSVSLQDGQLRDIEPGAGRMLGLLSVTQLPRRLALDFSDVTDEGLAFNVVKRRFRTAQRQCLHAEPAAEGTGREHRHRRPDRARDRGLRPGGRGERQYGRAAGGRGRACRGPGGRRRSAGAVAVVQGPVAAARPRVLPRHRYHGRLRSSNASRRRPRRSDATAPTGTETSRERSP